MISNRIREMEIDAFETGLLPMRRGRVIKTLSDSTIRSVLDALVELITNSDDSYVRLENTGNEANGNIDIYLARTTGGQCTLLRVIDSAEGMSFQTLKKSIEFSGETSGFKEGRTVRGFFGRGLKESIISLGKGKIITLKDGVLSGAEIYYDKKKRDALYKLATPMKGESEENLREMGFNKKTGTVVEIKILSKRKALIPSYSKIKDYISKHYSLRSICSSKKRRVKLTFYEPDKENLETTDVLKYEYPDGKKVFEDSIKIDDNDVYVRIFESMTQLTTPNTPQGTAGLLIKSEGAILDNRLFGYDIDPAGLYFYGEINCPGIAKSIRDGDESIVDYNRGGLAWRHKSNKKLEDKMKKILQGLIEKKRGEIKEEDETEVEKPVQEVLDRVCRELSKLAKDELEVIGPAQGEVNSLLILPMVANVQPGKPRALGVYAPGYLLEEKDTKTVTLSSSNPDIEVSIPQVTLKQSKKDRGVYFSSFQVSGKEKGVSAIISANLKNLIATCEVRVQKQKKRKKGKKHKTTGGVFSKIIPARDKEPIQRFEYAEGGIIRVYVKFPGVNKHLGNNFEKVHTKVGRTILSEIILEAFCRYIARQKAGKYFDEEIDPFLVEMDKLRVKASRTIYQMILYSGLDRLIK